MRRRLLLAVLLLILVGVGYITWTVLDPPPIRFLLRYGLSPGCEPTGQTMTFEGIEFVEIGPGVLRMGSTDRADGGDWLGRLGAPFGLKVGRPPKPSWDMPVHWVEFRGSFWIATKEITNAQYRRFDPNHKSGPDSQGDEQPVVYVPWERVREYCDWLAKRTAQPIRLPSEAEWECACRAGGEGHHGEAWTDANSGGSARKVGTNPANPWGLFDLRGNVWEWCEDSLHDSYEGAPADGSAWTEEYAPGHMIRGGSYLDSPDNSRSAYRFWVPYGDTYQHVGFRPAFSGGIGEKLRDTVGKFLANPVNGRQPPYHRIRPEDFAEWRLWELPPDVLKRFRITGIGYESSTDAWVEIRPDGDGLLLGLECEAAFALAREGADWRIYRLTFLLTENRPAPPPPTAAAEGTDEDGRPTLTLGIPDDAANVRVAERVAATGIEPGRLVLILRVNAKARFATLTPVLREAAHTGVGEIRIRGEIRQPRSIRTSVVVTGDSALVWSPGGESPEEIVYTLPGSAFAPELVVEFGPDLIPPRRLLPDKMLTFRTYLPPKEHRALNRAAEILDRPKAGIGVVVAPNADADVKRVSYVWHALLTQDFERLALATAGSEPAPGGPTMLVHGVPADEVADDGTTKLPKIPTEDPVRQRLVLRVK